MTLSPLFPLGNQNASFLGSMNLDFSATGKVTPVYNHAQLSGSANLLHYPIAKSIVTKDTDGNPIVFFAANKTVYAIRNGTITADKTFSTDVIQDLCMIDNGSGTKLLMAVFGNGSTINGNATRDMTVDVGGAAWTTNTGATMLTAFFVTRVGPHYYAVTGSAGQGRTGLGEWKVAICPFDQTNKHLAASWSTAEPVGEPNWQINGIAAYRDKLCVGKPDGFWIRDQKEKAFINLAERLALFAAHGVNGKVIVAGENCVWYGTYDRKLYRFDGHDLHDETPFREIEKPRDVILGRVEALVDRGETGYAVLGCWSDFLNGKHFGRIGGRVFKETNAGVITELTSSVTDGSLATGGSMNAWGGAGAAGSWRLVIGSPVRLESWGVRVTRKPNAAVQSFSTPETLNGSAAWVSLGSIVDGSILGTTGVSLALTGFPAGAGESILGWDGIDGFQLAQLDTYNGVSGLYWYSVKNVTTTAMTATTEIDEVFAIPARAGLPNSGVLTQSTNFTNRFRAGGLSVILEFRREGGRIVWYPKYTIHTLGGVFSLALTPGPMAISNSGSNLIVLGRFTQWVCAESPTADPSSANHPDLAIGSTTVAMPILCVRNLRLGDSRKLTKVSEIAVNGVFMQPTDQLGLVVQADEWKQFSFLTKRGVPAVWDVKDGGFGDHHVTHVWLPWKLDSALVRPKAPYIAIATIEHDDSGQAYSSLMQMAGFSNPEGV